MSGPSPSYFRYFPLHRDHARWGLGITACGFTHLPARSSYPPAEHPGDHQFSWEHGRILDCLQIILITSGRGILELNKQPPITLRPGMAFALLPGIWHRYKPDPKTGWDESWVELRGPVLVNFLGSAIKEDNAVLKNALAGGLELALNAIHHFARQAPPSFDPDSCVLGFGVLAAWLRAGQMAPVQPHLVRAVAAAERYLHEHQSEPIVIAQLAKKLGVAYSHFRREFKARTGYSPWQYVIHLRLSRAKRLLASTDATIEDIALRLGFSSGFHFSAAFKASFKVAPHKWRLELKRNASSGPGRFPYGNDHSTHG